MQIPQVTFKACYATLGQFEIIELDTLRKRALSLPVALNIPHRIMFHALLYITQGNCQHFIDFKHYQLKQGSVVSINADQVHALEFPTQVQGKIIVFTDEFLNLVRANIRTSVLSTGYSAIPCSPVLNANKQLVQSIDRLIIEMQSISGCNECDDQLLHLLFSSLLLKLHQADSGRYKSNLSLARQKKFNQFIHLIDTHFTRLRDSAGYAKMLGMTYKSLNQLCKRAVQQTPKKIIDAHTILEAKRRLAIEEVQVTKLAFDLGFDDVSNFIKYFKKHTSLTPEQFKISIKG